MSSWRFADVQHSLSLSCDFILRLPLSGVCLRSEVLFSSEVWLLPSCPSAGGTGPFDTCRCWCQTEAKLYFVAVIPPCTCIILPGQRAVWRRTGTGGSSSLSFRFVPPVGRASVEHSFTIVMQEQEKEAQTTVEITLGCRAPETQLSTKTDLSTARRVVPAGSCSSELAGFKACTHYF